MDDTAPLGNSLSSAGVNPVAPTDANPAPMPLVPTPVPETPDNSVPALAEPNSSSLLSPGGTDENLPPEHSVPDFAPHAEPTFGSNSSVPVEPAASSPSPWNDLTPSTTPSSPVASTTPNDVPANDWTNTSSQWAPSSPTSEAAMPAEPVSNPESTPTSQTAFSSEPTPVRTELPGSGSSSSSNDSQVFQKPAEPMFPPLNIKSESPASWQNEPSREPQLSSPLQSEPVTQMQATQTPIQDGGSSGPVPPMSSSPSPQPTAANGPKKGRSPILMLMVLAVVLVIAGLGFVFWKSQSAKMTPQVTPTPVAVVQPSPEVIADEVSTADPELIPTTYTDADASTVSGLVCKYADTFEGGTVYFYDAETSELFQSPIKDGENVYTISIPAGNYIAMFKPTKTDLPKFGFSQYVQCGLDPNKCTNHSLLVMKVAASKEYGQVQLCDPQYDDTGLPAELGNNNDNP